MEIDTLRQELADLFEYERWANRKWDSAAEVLGGEAEKVREHVLRAQEIWYSRCLSEADLAPRTGSLCDSLAAMAQHWQELIRTSDPTAYVSYQNSAGEKFVNLLEDIARHVVNHGTYHRGQLREMAAQNKVDFPETDFILWRRSADQG